MPFATAHTVSLHGALGHLIGNSWSAWGASPLNAWPPWEARQMCCVLAPEQARFALASSASSVPPALGGGFALALRVGAFAHNFAWVRQRDHLPEAARPEFDREFRVVLRRALALTDGG
jgi:hypothetical protein